MRYLLFTLVILLLASCREDNGILPADPKYRLLRADYLIGADTAFLASWEYRVDGRLDTEYYTNRLTGTPSVQTIGYTYFTDSILAISTTVTATDVIVTRYTILFNAQKLITTIKSFNEPTSTTIIYNFVRDAQGRLQEVESVVFDFIFSDRFIYSGNVIAQYSRYFPSIITPGKTDTSDVIFTYNNALSYRPVITPVEVLPIGQPSPYHQAFSFELCGIKTNPDPQYMVSSMTYLQFFGSDAVVTFDYTTDSSGKIISRESEISTLPGVPFVTHYTYEEL
jgi:hypothetical protein